MTRHRDPYYPEVRRLCVEITGRDNRAAHRRYHKLCEASLQAPQQIQDMKESVGALLEWLEEEYSNTDWGHAWEHLLTMSHVKVKPKINMDWVEEYIGAAQYIVGESW